MTGKVKTREHLSKSKVLSRKRQGYQVTRVPGSEDLYDFIKPPEINQAATVVAETHEEMFHDVKITSDPIDRYEQIHLQ